MMEKLSEKDRLFSLMNLIEKDWKLFNQRQNVSSHQVFLANELMHESLIRMKEQDLTPTDREAIWNFWIYSLNQISSELNAITPENKYKFSLVGHDLLDLEFNPWFLKPKSENNVDEKTYDAHKLIGARALRWVNHDFLKRLLVTHPESKLTTNFYHRLLQKSVVWNHFELAEFALENNANLNWADPKNGNSALFLIKSPEMLKWLIQKGADPAQKNALGYLCSSAWDETSRQELLKVLNESSVNVSESQQKELVFDGFSQYLIHGSNNSIAIINKKLREMGLKTNSVKSCGLSILALTADSCLLNRNRFGFLRMILSKKVNLEHESIPNVPDALWVYAVSLYSSDYGRVNAQIVDIRNKVKNHTSVVQFLNNESQAKKIISGLLEIPKRFQKNKAYHALFGYEGLLQKLLTPEKCAWLKSSTLFKEPHFEYGCLGWGILASGSINKSEASGIAWSLMENIKNIEDWDTWPAPTPQAVDQILLSIANSGLSLVMTNKNAEMLIDKIEDSNVFPTEEGMTALFENKNVLNNDKLRSRFERIRLKSLPSAPKSTKMRL